MFNPKKNILLILNFYSIGLNKNIIIVYKPSKFDHIYEKY